MHLIYSTGTDTHKGDTDFNTQARARTPAYTLFEFGDLLRRRSARPTGKEDAFCL